MMEKVLVDAGDVRIMCDTETGGVTQLLLYDREMLEPQDSAMAEIAVNDLPLKVRSEAAEMKRLLGDKAKNLPDGALHDGAGSMFAERFVNQYCGFGLEITRHLGVHPHQRQLTLSYHLHRGKALPTCPTPGPGGPAIESRMFVDTITVPRWRWKMWGDDTRMLHLSLQSTGPDGEFGHIGYNRGRVSDVKHYMGNIWRRQYPGVMAVHGAVYYDDKTGNWLAITCRRPQVGYYLDLNNAGAGLSYSFTLHDEFRLSQSLLLPEIKIYYGRDRAEMEQFIRDYTTETWHPVPEWNSHAAWFGQCLWSPYRDWRQFWSLGEKVIDSGAASALGPYQMIHNWSKSLGGTSPLGYEPDPAMGPREEFEKGALRMKDRGVPMGMWMSHSGLAPGRDIDDDWFIRGVHDNWTASWGSQRSPALVLLNLGHPGFIDYTKRWLKYYIELGYRWFFFDCAGWAMSPDFRKRSFMRFPGDTGLMAVRYYEEIVPYAESLDPGVVISGEGFSSDFPIHVLSINTNPVHSTDGLGPRDYLLSLNKLPGKRIVVDQAGRFVPASGVCVVGGDGEWPKGLSFDDGFGWVAQNRMLKAITKFVREHGIYHGAHLRGDISIIDERIFFPGHYDGKPVKLPEPHARYTKIVHAVTGQAIARAADGTFTAPEPGMYELKQ
jgi:hypothetical protein